MAREGQVAGAAALYGQVLAAFPANARARAGLAALPRAAEPGALARIVALHRDGQGAEALAAAQALAAAFPCDADLANIEGIVAAGAGRHEAALMSYERALSLSPDHPDAAFNRGNLLLSLGLPAEALESYARVSRSSSALELNRGNALRSLGRKAEALAAYDAALADGRNTDVLAGRGRLLTEMNRPEDAAESLDEAARLAPDRPDIRDALGAALMRCGRVTEAVAAFRAALALGPGNARTHNNLGQALAALGEAQAARGHLEEALRLDPGLVAAHFNLSKLVRALPGDPRLAQIEALMARPDKAEEPRLHFALAKGLDELGETARAFDHFAVGNRLRRRAEPYDIEIDRALFARITAMFTGTLPTEAGRPNAPCPIFVLGLPRSGTTLVEQILASHPAVAAGGELELLQRGTAEALERVAPTIPESIARLRDGYAEGLAPLANGRPFVTDKMPLNLRWIGFIRAAFPQAPIIHVRRDPRATCWSIFSHCFTQPGLGFGNDLADLAAYWHLSEELMALWHRLYPGRILDLSYEALTERQEDETRRLLEFCGLPWDAACLTFQGAARPVLTASSLQVRQGLYQGSSEAWRRYAPHIQPLLRGLDLTDEGPLQADPAGPG